MTDAKKTIARTAASPVSIAETCQPGKSAHCDEPPPSARTACQNQSPPATSDAVKPTTAAASLPNRRAEIASRGATPARSGKEGSSATLSLTPPDFGTTAALLEQGSTSLRPGRARG